VILALAALAVTYLAVVPVATMVIASLRSAFLTIGPSRWSFSHYVSTFTAQGFGRLVGNSFAFAGATTVLCILVGFGLAWLVTCSNTPARAFIGATTLVPLIIPGILNTVAWALLLAPHTGPVNLWLRALHLPAFDVYSLAGMVFVQSIHVVPLAFLMGVASFKSMDSSFMEAALTSGVRPLRAFRKVTLRMVRPAIMAAALLMFVQTVSTFEVPQLIGVPGGIHVFVSQIYDALEKFPPDYGSVGVIGVFIICIATLGLWASRRLSSGTGMQTITGKGYRPKVTDLGRWRWVSLAVSVLFFLISVALPLAVLIWSSFLSTYQAPSIDALHGLTLHNYRAVMSTPTLIQAVRNSLIVAISAAAVVTALSALVAYITVKTRIPGRSLLDGLATVPIAVPSIVVGVGVLYWYLVAPLPFHLYGTLAIIIIALVTISLPYSLRYLTPGMAQISSELEEAATTSGVSWPRAFRRIFLPLLMPSLLASFLYAMILAFREISAVIFLNGQGTQVMSVTIYQYWTLGSYPIVATLGVIMVFALTIVATIVRLLTRRIGVQVN
jgi:iron(III) transport system permease protein